MYLNPANGLGIFSGHPASEKGLSLLDIKHDLTQEMSYFTKFRNHHLVSFCWITVASCNCQSSMAAEWELAKQLTTVLLNQGSGFGGSPVNAQLAIHPLHHKQYLALRVKILAQPDMYLNSIRIDKSPNVQYGYQLLGLRDDRIERWERVMSTPAQHQSTSVDYKYLTSLRLQQTS